MQCDYHDAGRCRSCTLMGVPYARQLTDKQDAVAALLAEHVAPEAWLPTLANDESRFRNKAKLVVGGTTGAPTFGILDVQGRGVDLRRCGIYEPGLHEAVLTLAEVVPQLGLQPYAVPDRQGELKHVLVTRSPGGDLMVRFVLRSTNQLGRLRRGLPSLVAALPRARVVTANIQPRHVAVLEGDEEIVLTEDETLAMDVADVRLHLGARSFWQTSTTVADGLYRQVGDWVVERAPSRMWDLYCGVGGFALHCAARAHAAGIDLDVLGIEMSLEAIRCARLGADDLGVGSVRFVDGDAPTLAMAEGSRPDLVVVNPPRRGIGSDLARWLDDCPATTVVYSSCNPRSLARDLATMPSWHVSRARLVDMFPQTEHAEVLVRLERRPPRVAVTS